MACKILNPRSPIGSVYHSHDWETLPGRERCRRCSVINPVGVPPWERFWDYVEKTDGCWLWDGNKTHDGYGRFSLAYPDYKFDIYAHIYSYFLHRGKLPPHGMEFDHECRVRNCVRPDHLRFLTQAENVRRAVFKPICKRGHHQTPENRLTYGDGKERCRLCIKAIQEEKKAERRARGLKKPGRKLKQSSDGINTSERTRS